MRLLGNILWFIFGGFLSGLGWIIAGIICTLAVLCLGIADPIIRRRRQK